MCTQNCALCVHIKNCALCVHIKFIISFCVAQEIYKDRKKFSKAVFEVASSDLVNMGLSVVSYTLKDISDEEVKLTLQFDTMKFKY